MTPAQVQQSLQGLEPCHTSSLHRFPMVFDENFDSLLVAPCHRNLDDEGAEVVDVLLGHTSTGWPTGSSRKQTASSID